MKFYLTFLLILMPLLTAFCQTSETEIYLVANGNLFVPVKAEEKSTYPILWYDKDADPKFQVGGLGIGVSVFKSINDKFFIKGQGNFSRQAYWSGNYFVTEDGVNGTYLSFRTQDYSLALSATIHYSITKNLSAGTGLGSQVLLYSVSKTSDQNVHDGLVNKQYKPVMPVIPVELSLKFNKTLFNIRYEYGLLNRLRGDLADYQTEGYSLLVFEVGYRLK